jgi:hypothetical protein
LAAIELPYNIRGELRDALKESIAESFVASFRIIMFITSGLALGSALIAWLTIEGTGTRPKLVAKDSNITRLDQV